MKNNLKTIMGFMIVLGVGGYVMFDQQATVVYESEQAEEVVETPAWLEDADAVKAAEDVVRRKALEAERVQIKQQIEELEARLLTTEKELGF